MRYRALSATGDYTFGGGRSSWLVDSPEAVAQAVLTRLKLAQGEWFLDTTVGTPYKQKILGMGRVATYDAAIIEVILGTPGVTSLVSYSSNLDRRTRQATVEAVIDTQYGQATINSPI